MPEDDQPELLHKTATRGGFDVANVPGLVRRGNRWQFRRRVPAHLRDILGKTEVLKSLGDVSHREARRLAAMEWVETEAEFEDAERRLRVGQAPVELSDGELMLLSRRFFQALEEDAPAVPIDRAERAQLAEVNDDELALIDQGIDDASLQATALSFARWANADISANHPRFRDYCQLIHRAQIEHHLRQADRLALREVQFRDPDFSQSLEVSQDDPDITLGEAIFDFMSATERSDDAEKTKLDWRYHFAFFSRHFGDEKPMASISRKDVRDAVALLQRLPKHFRKKYPNQALEDVAAIAARDGLETLKPQTVRRYVTSLSALCKWLNAEGHQLNNPAADLNVGKDDKKDRPRGFTDAELNLLFSSDEFAKADNPSWMYWLPRIGLLNGMRINEIAGLRKADIVKIDGVWCFRIEPNEDRTIKTDASVRTIPVHPKLLELGLLDQATSGKADELLFRDIPPPTKRGFNAAEKRIGRRIRKLFSDKRLRFHSLRHSFRDATRRSKLRREYAAALGGWKLPDHRVMDDYGSGFPIALLRSELSKLVFEDVKIN